jgi:hypothetical protein
VMDMLWQWGTPIAQVLDHPKLGLENWMWNDELSDALFVY